MHRFVDEGSKISPRNNTNRVWNSPAQRSLIRLRKWIDGMEVTPGKVGKRQKVWAWREL